MACARLAIGVGVVGFAGGSQYTTAMENLRQAQFLFHCPVEVALTEELARKGILALGVATLYHEILDDAMEEQGVIYVEIHQFDEVVAMERCGVVEAQSDVAGCCLEHHLCWLLLVLCVGCHRQCHA